MDSPLICRTLDGSHIEPPHNAADLVRDAEFPDHTSVINIVHPNVPGNSPVRRFLPFHRACDAADQLSSCDLIEVPKISQRAAHKLAYDAANTLTSPYASAFEGEIGHIHILVYSNRYCMEQPDPILRRAIDIEVSDRMAGPVELGPKVHERLESLAVVPEVRLRHTRVDIVFKEIRALQVRVDMLEVVDIAHQHKVILRVVRAAPILYDPVACRRGAAMVRRIGCRIFMDRMIYTHAVLVKRDVALVVDLIANHRRLFALDRDRAPCERRSVFVCHVIRIEDGDVRALDVEAVRLHRAEVQDIAILWCSTKRVVPPPKTDVLRSSVFAVER